MDLCLQFEYIPIKGIFVCYHSLYYRMYFIICLANKLNSIIYSGWMVGYSRGNIIWYLSLCKSFPCILLGSWVAYRNFNYLSRILLKLCSLNAWNGDHLKNLWEHQTMDRLIGQIRICTSLKLKPQTSNRSVTPLKFHTIKFSLSQL